LARGEGRYRRSPLPVRIPDQLRAHHAARPYRRDHLGALLMEGLPILSLMLLVPMIGAALCLFSGAQAARTIALVATLIDLALGIVLWANYDIGGAQWQFIERAPIFAGFSWALGIDGIALMLIVLSV